MVYILLYLQVLKRLQEYTGCEVWWVSLNRLKVVSCPHVAEVVVLVCPHFPSLRYILPHDVLICVWNDWFMKSCCNRSCPHFPSLRNIRCFISLMMSWYSSFLRRRVIYYCCTDSRPILFLLKTVGRAETFESWPSEKGANSKWRTKKKVDRVAIVVEAYGAVCQLSLRLWNTSLAASKLCGHQAYVDMHYC